MTSSRNRDPLANFAAALLAGRWTSRHALERGKRACPRHNHDWARKAVRHVFRLFHAADGPRLDDLVSFLKTDRKIAYDNVSLEIAEYFWLPEAMSPAGPAAGTWPVPALTTAGQLAAWLGVTPAHLDWLADCRGLTVRQANPRLRHFVYQWQRRRRGRFRLIESPKPRLKAIQRKIVREVLSQIPTHAAAHGFRAGHSILSYAAPHAGQRIVLRFDLRDFFPSIHAGRIHALFHTAGYPLPVARLLTGLCTSRVPQNAWAERPEPREGDSKLGDRLLSRHLPQGAPTSPALANLCARRMDARLAGLARKAGAVYTRYADDLAFSGGKALERSARRFQVAVAVIAAEEGFELHFQKSRFMRRGVCQQLAGVVVNEHPNVRRPVYDTLKAILTNCARHGPETQNRTGRADFHAHLLGQIAYVEMINAARGRKLRTLFERIAW